MKYRFTILVEDSEGVAETGPTPTVELPDLVGNSFTILGMNVYQGEDGDEYLIKRIDVCEEDNEK